MVILLKGSRSVLEDEDNNDGTMSEGEEGGDEDVCMDGEDKPPYDLKYNVEGKKNSCINREHAEDSFEANNRNISEVRRKSHNTNVKSKTQAKPIDLSWTVHPKF